MPLSGAVRRTGGAARRDRRPAIGGPYNAVSYLNTPTPDGTGNGTHVDVVHVEAGLFGWKYWMAFTPFHASTDALENPTILVSNDGLAWQVHPNMTATKGEIDPTPTPGFNSDPDLILGQDGVLYCFYRGAGNDPSGDGVRVRSSTNGYTWSAETLLLSATPVDYLSPTVIWDGTQYVMYATVLGAASDGSQDTVVRMTCATPTGTWSAATTCTYPIPSGPRSPWHIDAFRMGTKTVLLVNEQRSSRTLGLASTTDGTTFTVSASPVMRALVGANWDSGYMYRSCAELHPNGVDLRVWYAAFGGGWDWHVGYTEMPRSLVP